MKPGQIIKKQIAFYRQEQIDTTDLENDKLIQINQKIVSGKKATLTNELIFSIGNILLAPAHRLVLEGKLEEGWTKFDRGIAWLLGYIETSSSNSSSLTDEPFAAVLGMSWLYEQFEATKTAIDLLNRRFVLMKEMAHDYVPHKEFLLALYQIYSGNSVGGLATDFLKDDHIYKRLIAKIYSANNQIVPLIEEACDFHLLHTPLMGNKNQIDFSFFELIPYEILCLFKTREKLGFEIQEINHDLMKTPLAHVQPALSTYKPDNDEPLQLVLKHAK